MEALKSAHSIKEYLLYFLVLCRNTQYSLTAELDDRKPKNSKSDSLTVHETRTKYFCGVFGCAWKLKYLVHSYKRSVH